MAAQSVGSRFCIQIPLSKLDPVRHQHRVQVATFASQVHYPIQTQCDTRYHSRFVLKFIIESYAVRRQHQVWVATFNFKFHSQNWTQCDTSTKCRWTLLGSQFNIITGPSATPARFLVNISISKLDTDRRQHTVQVIMFEFGFRQQKQTQCNTSTKCRQLFCLVKTSTPKLDSVRRQHKVQVATF